MSVLSLNIASLNAIISLRGFAESCGCGTPHADVWYRADISLACIGNFSVIVDDRTPEIAEALEGDLDHIVNEIIDDGGVKRTVIWRRHECAPHFIGLGEGLYLAPYWTQR